MSIVLSTHSGKYLTDLLPKGFNIASVDSKKFANGEISIKVGSSIGGHDVIVAATGVNNDWSVNDHMMETILLMSSLIGVRSITLVIPFFPYLRQDKRMCREPLSASVMCNMLSAYANRIITLDAHCEQFPGFFNPERKTYVVNASAKRLLCQAVLDSFPEGLDPATYFVVSPDSGSMKRAEYAASQLKLEVASMVKHRDYTKPNQVLNTVLQFNGTVSGRVAIILDDMIDTAGTIISAMNTLEGAGVTSMILIATHGLFSGPALERLTDPRIQRIYVTDSLPQDRNKAALGDKLSVVSVVPFLSGLLQCIDAHESVTEYLASH